MDITEEEIDDTHGVELNNRNTFKDIKEVTLNYDELKTTYKNKIKEYYRLRRLKCIVVKQSLLYLDVSFKHKKCSNKMLMRYKSSLLLL